MASVNSPVRRFLKPLLYKMLPQAIYKQLQVTAKYRDIELRLVEEPEMELLPQMVKPGTEVIDVGANYAYFIERLSRLVGAGGKVIGFEPIPFTYDVAVAVLKKLGLKNFTLYNKGVGEKQEKVTFRIPKQDFGAFSTGLSHIATRDNKFKDSDKHYQFSKEELVDCEIIALDEFLLPQLKNVSFVKIDIEGAEYFALKGMHQLLDKFKPVVLVEIQHFFMEGFGLKMEQLIDLITNRLGYRVFTYNTTDKKLHAFNGPVWVGNYILIHQSKLSDFTHLISN